MKGGVVAGLVGGAAIATFLAVLTIAGGGPLAPVFKGAALPFFAPARIMSPAFEPGVVAVGVLTHFAISIGWGVLFGLLFYGLSRAATLAAGLFWGLVVWLGMYYVALPMIGAGAVAQSTPLWQAVTSHLVFGLFTALGFLPFQRRLPRRIQPQNRGRPVALDRRTPITP